MRTFAGKLVNHQSYTSLGDKLSRAAEVAGTLHTIYNVEKKVAPVVMRLGSALISKIIQKGASVSARMFGIKDRAMAMGRTLYNKAQVYYQTGKHFAHAFDRGYHAFKKFILAWPPRWPTPPLSSLK